VLGVAVGPWCCVPIPACWHWPQHEGTLHVTPCSDIAAMQNPLEMLFGEEAVWPSGCRGSPTLLPLTEVWWLGGDGCRKVVAPFGPPPCPCKSGQAHRMAPQCPMSERQLLSPRLPGFVLAWGLGRAGGCALPGSDAGGMAERGRLQTALQGAFHLGEKSASAAGRAGT